MNSFFSDFFDDIFSHWTVFILFHIIIHEYIEDRYVFTIDSTSIFKQLALKIRRIKNL